MCNIKLNQLSPELYKEAVKSAKENNLEQNMSKLVSIAAKDGFTNDEKNFLVGLASKVNVDKLKTGEVPSQTIDFAEPGISFDNNTNNTQTKDSIKTQTTKEYLTQIFDTKIVAPIKNLTSGVNENYQEHLIENKIKLFEELGNDNLNKLGNKLTNPNDRVKFIELYDNLDSTTQKQLIGLLNKEISLASKDSQGKSLIENINDLTQIKKNKQTGESVNGKNLAKEAIAIIDNDKNVTQGYHGTCGAGSLQNLMRDTYPSELVRIVKDLASNGKAVLADNNDISSMKLARNSINYKESGRNQFSRIFQSAVMQRVALVGGDERTSGVKDIAKNIGFIKDNVPREIEYDIEKDDGGANAVKTGDSAADPYLLTSLMNRMLKGKASFKADSVYDISDLIGIPNNKILKSGTIACYKTDGDFSNKNVKKTEGLTGGRHYVMITDTKRDEKDGKTYVHFKNTADVDETKMELNEFKKRLEFTITKK
ncbi:MAG: hypothetical protein U0354_01450 [Candidatus Sericytochromatia bacterium]